MYKLNGTYIKIKLTIKIIGTSKNTKNKAIKVILIYRVRFARKIYQRNVSSSSYWFILREFERDLFS